MKLLKISLAFTLALLPVLAFANAGSPMMWFGLLHLFILNALIGWAESAIVCKFGIRNRTWLIIIANYISMFVGLYYIAPYFSEMGGNHDFWGGITRYGSYKLIGFTIGMLVSFLATLVIELPLFVLAIKNKEQRKQIVKPFLIANLCTNVAMTLIYFLIASDGAVWA